MAEIIEATHNVVFVATVAGVVADFTESVIAAMTAKIAQELGVSVGNVAIDVEAASVIITTTIGTGCAQGCAHSSSADVRPHIRPHIRPHM